MAQATFPSPTFPGEEPVHTNGKHLRLPGHVQLLRLSRLTSAGACYAVGQPLREGPRGPGAGSGRAGRRWPWGTVVRALARHLLL